MQLARKKRVDGVFITKRREKIFILKHNQLLDLVSLGNTGAVGIFQIKLSESAGSLLGHLGCWSLSQQPSGDLTNQIPQ